MFWLCVFVCTIFVPSAIEARRGHWIPWNRSYIDCYKLSRGCSELNLGPQKRSGCSNHWSVSSASQILAFVSTLHITFYSCRRCFLNIRCVPGTSLHLGAESPTFHPPICSLACFSYFLAKFCVMLSNYQRKLWASQVLVGFPTSLLSC